MTKLKLICRLAAGAALCGVLVGCDETPKGAERAIYDAPQSEGRFTIESHGKFKAGYQSNTREILILTDTKTGRQYLGITGVGVSELVTETTVRVSSDGKGHMTTVPDVETVER